MESILFPTIAEREVVEQELGLQLNLTDFIVSLMGLSAEHVNKAFAGFINAYQLNSKQIQFIDTLKQFLLKNGKVNPEKLYDSPFKNYHSMGIDGVFTEKQADVIFKIVEDFNQAN